MGDPKKIRKKYETPSIVWDTVRIQREHELKTRYGLKNLRELWIQASELRRVRKNVRDVLAGRSKESVGRDIIARLSRYGLIKSDAPLDDILVINVDAFLERRLQTIVLRKNMAKSLRQARQLVSHGFISINGKRVTSPGHLVTAGEEATIAYYKPINVMQQAPAQAPVPENVEVDGAEQAKGLVAPEATEAAAPAEGEGKEEAKGG